MHNCPKEDINGCKSALKFPASSGPQLKNQLSVNRNLAVRSWIGLKGDEIMIRTPEKQTGGKWSDAAFPPEAAMNFDEFVPEQVRELKIALESDFDLEDWEVVDGTKFPYG